MLIQGGQMLSQYLVEEHGGGLLHVVATCVEQWVKSEVGTLREILSVAAPRHRFATFHAPPLTLHPFRIHTDADRLSMMTVQLPQS